MTENSGMLRHRWPLPEAPSSHSDSPPEVIKEDLQPDLKSTKCTRLEKRNRRIYWTKVLGVATAIYLFIPYWFYTCPWWRRQVIFLNNINFDPLVDMSAPQDLGHPCARNFYVTSEEGVHLGAWHLPPASMKHNGTCPKPLSFEGSRPVVLYFHGTGFTRAAGYRRSFYRVVTESEIDAHVIAFDYRGFGDSTNMSPSMKGVVDDAETMYKWLLNRVSKDRLVLWGHSLGSGIAIQLAAKFSGIRDLDPPLIILESSFTSMYDAVYSFPFSALHNFLPFFDSYVALPIGSHPDTRITNDDKIGNVTSAILMMHAADDGFLSVEKARLLHRLGQRGRMNKGLPEFRYVEFEAGLGYGHMRLNSDPKVPRIVNEFMRQTMNMSSFRKNGLGCF